MIEVAVALDEVGLIFLVGRFFFRNILNNRRDCGLVDEVASVSMGIEAALRPMVLSNSGPIL